MFDHEFPVYAATACLKDSMSIVGNLEVVRYSGALHCNYYCGDFNWCMQQCPYFGKRESTVMNKICHKNQRKDVGGK